MAVTEEDPLIAEIDAYMDAGPSSGPTKKPKAFQFLDLFADEVVSVQPDELLLQEQELTRLKQIREEELASAAEVQKAKEEEAKAYKKIAESDQQKLDSTALQLQEIELLTAEKAKQHAEKEKKRLQQWNDYVKKMNFRMHPDPITELTWKVRNNRLDLTVFRGGNPFNFQVIREATIGMFGVSEWAEMLEIIKRKRSGKIQTDLMEALQKRFAWKLSVEKKFGVDLSQPLAEQGPAASQLKKRKRAAEGAEVRVTVEPQGEGLAPRNLALPKGVKFREGKVISEPEHGMFFTNNAQIECFQRVNELHLCSTWQLYLLKSTCQRGSNDAEFLSLIEIELEPRDKDVKKMKKAKLEEMNIE